MAENKKTIVLAAGGTGGHLYPAEALAEELLARGHRVIILTDKRGQAFKSLGEKVKIDTVRAGYMKAGLVNKIKSLFDIGLGIVQAGFLLKKYQPDVIVGFGGYPSFPAVFAGQRLGLPTILHEQNAVLGKANLFLADAAENIATAFPDTRGIKEKNRQKSITTGNPVRAAIVAVRDIPYTPPREQFNIFVTGGSQASTALSDVIPDAVGRLPDALKSKLSVTHQARESDLGLTQEKYAKAGVRAEIKTFFNDIADRLRDCHLFIGRSGATTVTEMAVVGRPAIFVPDPRHADMQQKFNAEVVSAKGGAWIMLHQDFTPESLSKKLEELMRDPAILERAAAAAKACGQPEAVKNLANLVEKKFNR